MQESSRARDALLRFYEAFTEAVPGDMESFNRVFSRDGEPARHRLRVPRVGGQP